jgi:predicted glycoside hydrolase/deacetylase ChbG (UPF0249 family)
MFRHGFVSLLRLVNTGGSDVLDQIDRELNAQLMMIRAAGIAIDHVNSHRHVHMIPQILRIVVRLVANCAQSVVRISTEPWHLRCHLMALSRLPQFLRNAPKNLILSGLYAGRPHELPSPRVAHVYGILGSGRMDVTALEETIEHLPVGTSEVLTHPAVDLHESLDSIAPGDRAFVKSEDRQRELEALMHTATREALTRAQVQLISFRDLNTQTIAAI